MKCCEYGPIRVQQFCPEFKLDRFMVYTNNKCFSTKRDIFSGTNENHKNLFVTGDAERFNHSLLLHLSRT
jgi:hypothetical protein